MKKQLILSITAASLIVLGSASASAGTCTVRGQALVAAYTLAMQNGYRFDLRHNARNIHGKMHKFYIKGKFYARPGKLGFKYFNARAGYAIAKFFTDKQLKHGWKFKSVAYGGSPTQIRHRIGGNGFLLWNEKGHKARSFNVYVTSFTLQHRTKSCANDPVSQQIALQNAMKD